MLQHHLGHKITTWLLGLIMIAAALAAGAYFGVLTSPDTPAADASEAEETICSTFCPGMSISGSGGNVGAPTGGILGGTGSGGTVGSGGITATK